MTTTTDRIEKQIVIKAPQSRVWRALSVAEEFGEWFQVDLKGKTFKAGESISGLISFCGHEDHMWRVVVERIEPEHHFSFRWHPYAVEKDVDYSTETPTLVEFELKPVDGGTLLTVVESGFDSLPPARRLEAFRMNDGGWAVQLENIDKYATTA